MMKKNKKVFSAVGACLVIATIIVIAVVCSTKQNKEFVCYDCENVFDGAPNNMELLGEERNLCDDCYVQPGKRSKKGSQTKKST